MKRILTVAGSDSGGGAGIQADLKTITVLGGYGLSVLTALTAQNTTGVAAVHDVPPDFIRAQFTAVMDDIGCDAAKTGMLSSAEVVRVVADCLRQQTPEHLVVDPVMVAKGGHRLLAKDAVQALIDELLPLATMVTPNLPEAEVLGNITVTDVESMADAARAIFERGPKLVLIKGGHLTGPPVDVMYDGERVHRFEGKRIDTKNTHGTGCTLSAALATFLAQGLPAPAAVRRAKLFLERAMMTGPAVGAGHRPTNPLSGAHQVWERYSVIEAVELSLGRLARAKVGRLIPEVRSNLAYAMAGAKDHRDVAAVPGRITALEDEVAWVRGPRFGASQHMAAVVMAAMGAYPDIRSAMNVRFSGDIIKVCRELGFHVREFSRADEPPEIKVREGSTLEWGTRAAVTREPGCPDIVFDRGESGKEPMVRVLGEDPDRVVSKVIRIMKGLRGQFD